MAMLSMESAFSERGRYSSASSVICVKPQSRRVIPTSWRTGKGKERGRRRVRGVGERRTALRVEGGGKDVLSGRWSMELTMGQFLTRRERRLGQLPKRKARLFLASFFGLVAGMV
jgi:hypothetical protein